MNPAATIESFFGGLPFPPDEFQRTAAAAIADGRSVVVTAPTGAGKTLIAEAAVFLAASRGARAFYTTPIKALSNQKYADFVDEYGEARVGLLTGDNSINGDAPVVVMTTEVLRNMIYARSPALTGLGIVVLDEVHYLADRFRGSVWEEIIIHAPASVQLVCLSATIANPEEFTEWVAERRGPTDLVVESHRPVPLEPMYMVSDLWAKPKEKLFAMFAERHGRRRPNPAAQRLLASKTGRRRRFATPRRPEIVAQLRDAAMLPAIHFVFSRAGCEQAARQVAGGHLRLTSPEERSTIREIATTLTTHLTDDDLEVLGFGDWLSDLEAGVAAHHAGMVPAFKETVEALFGQGLIKVVFATETLALGINMPARTVVLDSMSKFNGESHELLTPSDYTQLTGRAGRRGIDEVGYGVCLYSRFLRFERMAEIAHAGAIKLESSFRPSYNMAVNLVANYDPATAEALLSASFAEFQQTRLAQLRRAERAKRLAELHELRSKAECRLGDIWEYLDRLDSAGGSAEMAAELRPGDVVELASGAAPGRYLLLQRRPQSDRPVVLLSAAGKLRHLGADDLLGANHVGRIEMSGAFRPRDRRFQQRLVQQLRAFRPRGEARALVAVDHPVARCEDAAEHLRLARQAQALDERLGRRSASSAALVEVFRKILTVLERRGYVDGWELTRSGSRLRFIYSELDLLVAETLRLDILGGLRPPDLAAVASGFVYEARLEAAALPPPVSLVPAIDAIDAVWEGLVGDEIAADLAPTNRPDFGMAEAVYHWAQGLDLEEILDEVPMAAGDFVRLARQLLDLLRQIRDAEPALGAAAGDAIRMVDRGVVAAGGRL